MRVSSNHDACDVGAALSDAEAAACVGCSTVVSAAAEVSDKNRIDAAAGRQQLLNWLQACLVRVFGHIWPYLFSVSDRFPCFLIPFVTPQYMTLRLNFAMWSDLRH